MFRRPHQEQLLTDLEVRGAMTILMRIDRRVAEIHAELDVEEDDDGEDPEENA